MSTTTSTVVPSASNSELTSLRAPQWPEFVALGGYIALIALAVAHHEPWADEAQAWQLARSVPLFDLFRHALRYEGHPILWYAVLAALNKLHIGYTGMHWFCGVAGCIGTAMLIFLSPLPRYFRLSLPFTFFLAFQYVVVARSYVLVPLILYCVALIWRRNIFVLALLLGLLGNVSLHALAISIGFFLVYIIELRRGRLPNPTRNQIYIASSIVGTLYLLSLVTVIPRPSDLLLALEYGKPLLNVRLLGPLRSALFLCDGIIQPNFLALPVWFYVWCQFRGTRESFYLLPIATVALFSGYIFNFWHAGLIIPTAIAIWWIAWPWLSQKLSQGSGPLRICITFCIAIQCIWTIRAVNHHPYSADIEAARVLAPNVNSGDTLALTYVNREDVNAFHSIGLAPYFDHPIFINQPRPYWLWSTQEHTFAEFERAMDRHPGIVVAMFWDTYHRFDPTKDLTGARIARIQRDGYRLTNTFCAEKPEGFYEPEETCFLIYQRGPR